MSNRSTIALPDVRVAQLNQLAAHHGVTATDLVSGWIVADAQRAGLTDNLPGFDIVGTRDDDTGQPLVIFAAPLLPVVHLNPAEARELTAGIASVVAGEVVRVRVDATPDGGTTVEFAKKGRGFRMLVISHGSAEPDAPHTRARGFKGSLALEVADAIDAAAEKAEEAGA